MLIVMLVVIMLMLMLMVKMIMLLQIQGKCPSNACAGSCQECGEGSPDDVDCWGVR